MAGVVNTCAKCGATIFDTATCYNCGCREYVKPTESTRPIGPYRDLSEDECLKCAHSTSDCAILAEYVLRWSCLRCGATRYTRTKDWKGDV